MGFDINSKSLMKMNVINGIFLIIIAVLGNFVAETLSCPMQKVITNNMYVKNIVIILIIYFSIGFTSSEENISPIELLKYAIAIWVFFIMFNKMNIYFSGIVFSMIVILLICNNYISYYEKDDIEKHKDKIENLDKAVKYLFNTIIVFTILGFALYFKKQRKDYSKSFSYSKFILGTTKCAGL